MHIEEFTQALAALKRLPSDRIERALQIAQGLSEEDRDELLTGLRELDAEMLELMLDEEDHVEQMEEFNVMFEKMLGRMTREGAEIQEQESGEAAAAQALEDA
jgi:hypothetical protein